MQDPGPPSSYLALAEGTPVYTSDDRQIGTVERVLADPDADVFDGIVVHTSPGPGGLRFVDAPEVAAIHERAVQLTLDAAAAERLPEPEANPAVVDARPDAAAEGGLQRTLRRAWDFISGRY